MFCKKYLKNIICKTLTITKVVKKINEGSKLIL